MNDKKIIIELNSITEEQAIAIEDMLATWENLGDIGSSRWTAFFADGDGNFRPEILIDGRKPEKTKLLNQKKLWNTIKIKVAPTKENGLAETQWFEDLAVYMIDFDDIIWEAEKKQE